MGDPTDPQPGSMSEQRELSASPAVVSQTGPAHTASAGTFVARRAYYMVTPDIHP
jgi:hypothetical protein